MISPLLASLTITTVSALSLPDIRSTDSSLPVAEFTAAITGKVSRPAAFESRYERIHKNKPVYQKPRGKGFRGAGGKSGGKALGATLGGTGGDAEYLFNLTVGTPPQHFQAIIDTGSSDPWLVSSGFQCLQVVDSQGDIGAAAESACAFGATFNPKASKTWKSVPNVNLNITYGDQEFVAGPVGTDTMTIGGLTVTGQQIGAPNAAYWVGDGYNTGIIGLAYPELTSVYRGTDPTKDNFSDSIPYNPFFFTAVSEKKVLPVFSVALNRGSFDAQLSNVEDAPLGFVSFGGLAPVPVTKTTVTVPNSQYNLTDGTVAYLWYTVEADLVFKGSNQVPKSDNPSFYILDTGTTLNYVPNTVAEAYANSFHPPATLSDEFGGYIVPCNATVPPQTVVIGGASFPVDAADQLVPFSDDEGNVHCFLGTQPGGTIADNDIFILGDVFLHNVVLTANVKTNQITLTERAPYSSN